MLPSWLERKTSPSDVTSDTLYLRKAVTADEAGRTYLDSFSPPRRVTYLANQMAFSSNDDLRSMAEDLTKLTLDTPMSSSDFLQRLAGHRLTARITCAVADVKHPATLAFWLPWKSRQAYSSVCATVRVIRMEKKTFGVPDVEPYIHEFFHSGLMDEVDKVSKNTF
nr:hypothetical protein BaRGS_014940 [Batillaria attramentaria]